MNENTNIQPPVKKKKPLLIIGIICLIACPLLFFLVTFTTVILKIIAVGGSGELLNFLDAVQPLTSIFQILIPLLLLFAGIVLVIVSIAIEK